MKNWNLILLCFLFVSTACGVRGRPSPPETPPVLGHGEPSYSKATEKVKLLKKKKSQNSKDDWNEPEDFPEGEH